MNSYSSVFLFLLVAAIYSCGYNDAQIEEMPHENDKNAVGILEEYLDILLAHSDDYQNKTVLVTDCTGWDKGKSHITITHYLNKYLMLDNNHYLGEYNGHRLVLHHGNLYVDPLDSTLNYVAHTTLDEIIPNYIDWVKVEKPILDRSQILTPPYDPVELQLIYNREMKCIEDILLNRGMKNMSSYPSICR